MPQRAGQGDDLAPAREQSALPPEARYGVGADEFDELVRQQGGVCPICGRADPEHVDHSHDTGDVRGILCFNCNGGLGQFRDSPDALRNAAEYLEASDPEAKELAAQSRARAGGLRQGAV